VQRILTFLRKKVKKKLISGCEKYNRGTMAEWPGDEDEEMEFDTFFNENRSDERSKGFIRRCWDFLFFPDYEIIAGLQQYKVIDIKRLYSIYNGEEYGTYILTFGTAEPPKYIRWGFEAFVVDPEKEIEPDIVKTSENQDEKIEKKEEDKSSGRKKKKTDKRKRNKHNTHSSNEKKRDQVTYSARKIFKEEMRKAAANARDKPPDDTKRIQMETIKRKFKKAAANERDKPPNQRI
jgi:hypothetical protein